MIDYNEEFNCFDKRTSAAEWFNFICKDIAWYAFQNQEDWLYMMDELGEDRNPKIKDNFYEVFGLLFDREIAYIKECVLDGFLKFYHDQDIDVSKKVADEYNEIEGYEPGEDGYMEGRDD